MFGFSKIQNKRFSNGAFAIALLLLVSALLTGCGKIPEPVSEKPAAEPQASPPHEAPIANMENAELSSAAVLYVQVNHCEYGEPEQVITDPAVIAAAAKAISEIKVTGGSDGVSSTETYYVYRFEDAKGNALASYAFQHDMLMRDDGRYPVSGLEALYAVEGIMLTDDWEEYWRAEDEKEYEYAENYALRYPASLFGLSGYNASLLEHIDPARIGFVRIRVSWNDEAGVLETQDAEVIRSVYEALSSMRAVGKVGEDAPVGQKWSVYFSFTAPEELSDPFSKTAYLSFEGDYFLSDLLDGGTEMPYIVEGLDKLFDCTNADVLSYLKENRSVPRQN